MKTEVFSLQIITEGFKSEFMDRGQCSYGRPNFSTMGSVQGGDKMNDRIKRTHYKNVLTAIGLGSFAIGCFSWLYSHQHIIS